MQIDYYKILGVSRDATAEQIRKAYRSKAKLYHPDINRSPNANVLFQLINEAYQVLVDSEKKKWYDFKMKYPSTTGMKPQAERRRTVNYETYYKAYTRYQQEKKEEELFSKRTTKIIDNFSFYFLVLAGFMAIIYSTIDLIFDKVNMKNMGGMIFGVWFLLLMFLGWSLLKKK
jgi:curved DNA-binding protein CbpA